MNAIILSGLVYLITRVTKAIIFKRLKDRDRVLSDIVVGVENYSNARKSNNKNVKKSIAESVGVSKVLDEAINKVEGKDKKKSIIKVIVVAILKIVAILL